MAVMILVFSPSLVHIRACFETKFIKSKPPRDCSTGVWGSIWVYLRTEPGDSTEFARPGRSGQSRGWGVRAPGRSWVPVSILPGGRRRWSSMTEEAATQSALDQRAAFESVQEIMTGVRRPSKDAPDTDRQMLSCSARSETCCLRFWQVHPGLDLAAYPSPGMSPAVAPWRSRQVGISKQDARFAVWGLQGFGFRVYRVFRDVEGLEFRVYLVCRSRGGSATRKFLWASQAFAADAGARRRPSDRGRGVRRSACIVETQLVFEEVGLTVGRRDSIADALAYEVRFQELRASSIRT